ncbi:hypothetical protein KO566_11695 [Flavobacteriaceae bacterium XHP0103]|uniref:hypothetical protein n=1 Tax=Marixanthotalea marina TaxID=2844359 RepID=UPI002989F710|nr:hypothetical protein [Marixanthotalea marina]MBU3822728.1 hypothetical protein [Marixanthotalea marina]
MIRFLKNSIIVLVGIFAAMFILDLIYTEVYINSISRNKTQYLLKLDEGEKIDYVFLGSSRVENTIVSTKIETLTGKRTLNLGTQSAKLEDINLFLRLLIAKRINLERLFVQVDYIYDINSNSEIVRSQALPFIRKNKVIEDYLKKVDSNYFFNYYVPFYRYAANDYKLGFRGFFASLVGKESNTDFSDGFVPLYGSIKDEIHSRYELPKSIAGSNRNISEIDSLCRANDIKVTYFCAPFCSGLQANGYLKKLKSKLPNFEDFSTLISDDFLFQSCGHLNNHGAEVFTEQLVKQLNL